MPTCSHDAAPPAPICAHMCLRNFMRVYCLGAPRAACPLAAVASAAYLHMKSRAAGRWSGGGSMARGTPALSAATGPTAARHGPQQRPACTTQPLAPRALTASGHCRRAVILRLHARTNQGGGGGGSLQGRTQCASGSRSAGGLLPGSLSCMQRPRPRRWHAQQLKP